MDGEITVDELADLLDREADAVGETLRIVDIRQERSFRRGHVPGSESIPFTELTARVAELAGAERVVTVCPHGISSRQAAQLIGSYAGTADARVESLQGGLEAWERDHELAVDETTREPDEGPAGGPDAPF